MDKAKGAATNRVNIRNYLQCKFYGILMYDFVKMIQKMIQSSVPTVSSEMTLADDTNDAVDDIVAGLITTDPIFGPRRLFLLYCHYHHRG